MAGYIGSGASVVSSGVERKKVFDITTNTTSLTGLNYTVGKVHVYHNGVRLVDGTDFTANNSTSITLTVAAVSGDQVVVVSYASFQVADIPDGTPSIDDNGNATAITIDSSENVMVGKTTTALATAGIALGESGFGSFTRSGYEPLNVNRLSSDGDIAKFYKDGTTVGSIASGDSGNEFKWYGTFSSGAGLGAYSNVSIRPLSNTGAASDGAVNLGHSSQRFKDAYLSGGVYLGGTGSANKLEDYEEGTFTPVVTFGGASVGITYTSGRQSGIYTKVGNLVTYSIHLEFTNKGTSTGALQVTGVPFTASNNDKYTPASVFIQAMNSMSTLPIFRVMPNSTVMDCYQMVSSSYSGVTNSNCTNTSGFVISGQFYTDS